MVLQGGMFYLPVSLPGWAADPGTLLDHTVAPLGPEDAEQEPPVPADPVADDPAEQEQGEEGADVARAPRAMRKPSQQERDTHQLTHLPYQEWCGFCVQGKGRDGAHRRTRPREVGQPFLVELDYGFLRTDGEGDELSPILVAVVVETGHGFAAKVERKGNDPTAVKAVCKWLDEAGLAGQPVELQTDAEAPSRSWLEKWPRRVEPLQRL